MAENNRNLGGQQNESREDQQNIGGRMNGQQGQESGRGSYGSHQEDLQQNTSVDRNQTPGRSNAQSSSVEDDSFTGSDRNDISTDRNESTQRGRQDEYGTRSGSL